VVRELTQKWVWFAEPLISATADEVRRLIARAKAWADSLGKPVALWISDKQDAFVSGIAAEFPEVPHRYCDNHFLRDAAKPVLEMDSHAKVQMRKKVRGLRVIEQAVLKEQGAEESRPLEDADPGTPTTVDAAPAVETSSAAADSAGRVVPLREIRMGFDMNNGGLDPQCVFGQDQCGCLTNSPASQRSG
jgi:hypothetical protein